jgi:hypothetical protein
VVQPESESLCAFWFTPKVYEKNRPESCLRKQLGL